MMMAMMIAIATSASAMSYEQARREALFLADKMAYELHLSDAQYEAVYEANLDYLMSLNGRRQLYGSYWTRRNNLLEIILAPWQYAAYAAADYFFRPVYWASNAWQWRIYTRYGHTRYYRERPAAYVVYKGGRSLGYYKERNWHKPARPDNWNRSKVYKEQSKVYKEQSKVYRKAEKEREKMYRNAEKNRRHFEKDMRKAQRGNGHNKW